MQVEAVNCLLARRNPSAPTRLRTAAATLSASCGRRVDLRERPTLDGAWDRGSGWLSGEDVQDDLGQQLRSLYGFLAEPDDVELAILTGGASSRGQVLDASGQLHAARYANRALPHR